VRSVHCPPAFGDNSARPRRSPHSQLLRSVTMPSNAALDQPAQPIGQPRDVRAFKAGVALWPNAAFPSPFWFAQRSPPDKVAMSETAIGWTLASPTPAAAHRAGQHGQKHHRCRDLPVPRDGKVEWDMVSDPFSIKLRVPSMGFNDKEIALPQPLRAIVAFLEQQPIIGTGRCSASGATSH